ncbi:MAG: outer membrane beta-barrel family protein [Cellulophaga sp.]
MKSFIFLLLFASITILNAQQTTLEGTVHASSSKNTLEVTAITVFNSASNKLITYTYSDAQGHYTLNIDAGIAIYVKAELLGYLEYTSEKILPSKGVNKKNIMLQENTEELEEVVLLQKKKLIRLSGDKMVYDVENSGVGDGKDGLEVIRKIPGMRLDKDENIVFRGSTNIQVMINGKRSLMTGDALTQYLKTLGGENIKNIEIIANPSARYDAEGTAGIVNILLKKSQDNGLTGNISSSVAQADFFRHSNAMNLFYQKGKWSLNGGGRFARFNSVNNREIIQTINNPGDQIVFEQLNDWYPESGSASGKFGVEYTINKNKTIGSSVNYNSYTSDENTEGRTNEYYNKNYLRYTILDKKGVIDNKTLTSNLYYSFASDSLDTKFNIQLNYAHYNNKKNTTTTNEYFLVNNNSKYQDDFVLKHNNPARYHIFNTKLDYERKLGKGYALEAGLKYSYVNNDYDNDYANLTPEGEWIPNTSRNNQLVYKESILSGYGIASWNSEKWSLQVGLRTEYINFKATSVTIDQITKDNYTALFPSFSMNRSLENDKLQFSYSKRINRPRYLDLNPFYEYIDTYNVTVGNPDLKPQFSDNFNFTWVHKQNTSISVYSNFSTDVIQYIVDYDPITKITTSYSDNIATSTNAGLSLTTTITPTEWWSIHFNGNASYNRSESNIPDYEFNTEGYNWYVMLTNTLALKNNWTFNHEVFYDNGGTYGNWANKSSYDMSFSIKKMLFDKKLRLQFKGDNILKTSFFSSIITQGNVRTDWTNKWETRRFTLSATYNFGSGKRKSTKQIDLQDEKNRL